MASITVEDYPGAKPFYAGAKGAAETRFMLNYDQYSLTSKLASEGTLGGNAYMNSLDRVILPDAESSITLGKFNFGSEGSKLQVYYTSDIYQATMQNIPDMEVTVQLDDGTVYVMRDAVMVHGQDLNTASIKEFLIPGTVKGSGTVKISVSKNLLQLVKARVDEANFAEESSKRPWPADSAAMVWGGSLDEMIGGTGALRTSLNLSASRYTTGTVCGVSDTNDHTFLYKDRVFTSDATKAKIMAGSSYDWSNIRINVRVDSPNAEPVATFDLGVLFDNDNHGWHRESAETELTQAIPAGTHDIYLEFEGNYKNPLYPASRFNNAAYGTCDFYFTAFYN